MERAYRETIKSNRLLHIIEEKKRENIDDFFESIDENIREKEIRESDFLKRMRKKYSEGDRTISIDTIAEGIGLSKSYLKKQVAKTEPIKRDCVIAIGVFLRVSLEDANALLKHYQFSNLDKTDERDAIIIGCLEKKYSVKSVSKYLNKRQKEPLDLNLQSRKNIQSKENKSQRFSVLKKRVRPLQYPGKQDIYNSLRTEYYPDYYCVGDMLLKDVNNGQYYVLSMTVDDRCWYIKRPSSAILPISFESLEDTGEFKDYYIELKAAVTDEKQRMEAILNDTKNYKRRISANLMDDAIHIFIEEFNYSIPEWHEYYMVEVVNGEYRYSIFNESNFMRCYLTKDEYSMFYPSHCPSPIESYSSLHEIEELKDKERLSMKKSKYTARRKAFERLQSEVDKCWQDLKDRKKFVQNLHDIYEDEYDEVFRYYGIEDDFDCRPVDEFPGWIRINKQEATFSFKSTGNVTIEAEDVYRAFELGFRDIEQICRVKKKRGSIEAVLQK